MYEIKKGCTMAETGQKATLQKKDNKTKEQIQEMKVTARNKRDGKYSTLLEYRNSSVSLAEEIISELSREEKQSFGVRKRTTERVILLS